MSGYKKETGSVAAEAPSEINPHINSTTTEKQNQVLGKDAVAAIKTKYPGFDHSLWSKCKRPDLYGITLTLGAKKLVTEQRGCRKDNRTKEARWGFRVTKATHKRLQTAMQKRGITSKQTFLEAIVLKWLEENENV
jgi:hypothetical protein